MKKITTFLFSGPFMAFLLIVLAIGLAAATFIENDFGTEVARLYVYNALWFEFLLLLLCINLVGRSIQLKLYKWKKFSIFLFHIAWVIMIFGAGVTRYFGYEGSMHIREGASSSTIVTNQKILGITVGDEQVSIPLPTQLENIKAFDEKITLKNSELSIERTRVYKNAYKKAVADPNGKTIIGFIISGNQVRGFEYLEEGQTRKLGDLTLAFEASDSADIIVSNVNDSIYISSKHIIFANDMGNQSEQLISDKPLAFKTKTLYRINNYNLVLQEVVEKGKITAMPSEVEKHMRGMQAITFSLKTNNEQSELTLWEEDWNKKAVSGKIGSDDVSMFYGNKTIHLPFSIHLKNFVIERYPGSMSPSSFSSYVTLHESGNDAIPFHIYMNNILMHKGFRFYQSSYDQDEKGTILSVNNDKWGTTITYFGYFVLFLGIILSMINKHSFFRKTNLSDLKTTLILGILFTGSLFSAQAQHDTTAHLHKHDHASISKQHAEAFGELLIQNPKGRTEPVYTFASELIRKISRSEKMFGLTPMQMFMELHINPQSWLDIPFIQVTNQELQQELGVSGKYASYTSFISPQEGYLLQQKVQMAFAKPPAKRTKYDKAIIKADEKVNICYALFSGRYLKIFPIPGSKDSLNWHASNDAKLLAQNEEDSLFLSNILGVYFEEVNKAKTSNNYDTADEYLQGIINFQQHYAGYQLPSQTKRQIEIAYFKYNPFKKLFPLYASLGLIFLLLLIFFIVRGRETPKSLSAVFFYVISLAFAFHTLGIAARWYISGHAPMSNGYESMIFISWVALLSGFIYHKRSDFALPATVVLSGLTLMVANLSFMDPEITNLVPVLQSYWLTIHVSVITASYSFLGFGALLGIINLLLMILVTDKNSSRLLETIKSLTIINHKTLILGLYLLTIGTFLGAVWANESWGRYWGWDPKETWALISILVYTIVTHARLINGMKGIFIFNALSISGFASILMTYFGVNYYLSGMHSYAGGDPVPVPNFVYYAVASIMILTFVASLKYRKIKPTE